MGLGVPELIMTVVFAGVGLIPLVVTIWAVLTLRDVQKAQTSIERRLEAIERLLQQR